MKRFLSVLILLAVFFTCTTLDLQAAELQTANAPHSVSAQEMHKAVQGSDQQANAIRRSVQGFFMRPDVAARIQRIGFTPEQMSSHAAALSDSDLQRLNQQIMAADMQKETAGLSAGAIAAIVIAACAGFAAIVYMSYRLTSDIID